MLSLNIFVLLSTVSVVGGMKFITRRFVSQVSTKGRVAVKGILSTHSIR